MRSGGIIGGDTSPSRADFFLGNARVRAALEATYSEVAGELPVAGRPSHGRFLLAVDGFVGTTWGTARYDLFAARRYARSFRSYLTRGGPRIIEGRSVAGPGLPEGSPTAYEQMVAILSGPARLTANAPRVAQWVEARVDDFIAHRERGLFRERGSVAEFMRTVKMARTIAPHLEASHVPPIFRRLLDGAQSYERHRNFGDPQYYDMISSELLLRRDLIEAECALDQHPLAIRVAEDLLVRSDTVVRISIERYAPVSLRLEAYEARLHAALSIVRLSASRVQDPLGDYQSWNYTGDRDDARGHAAVSASLLIDDLEGTSRFSVATLGMIEEALRNEMSSFRFAEFQVRHPKLFGPITIATSWYRASMVAGRNAQSALPRRQLAREWLEKFIPLDARPIDGNPLDEIRWGVQVLRHGWLLLRIAEDDMRDADRTLDPQARAVQDLASRVDIASDHEAAMHALLFYHHRYRGVPEKAATFATLAPLLKNLEHWIGRCAVELGRHVRGEETRYRDLTQRMRERIGTIEALERTPPPERHVVHGSGGGSSGVAHAAPAGRSLSFLPAPFAGAGVFAGMPIGLPPISGLPL